MIKVETLIRDLLTADTMEVHKVIEGWLFDYDIWLLVSEYANDGQMDRIRNDVYGSYTFKDMMKDIISLEEYRAVKNLHVHIMRYRRSKDKYRASSDIDSIHTSLCYLNRLQYTVKYFKADNGQLYIELWKDGKCVYVY